MLWNARNGSVPIDDTTMSFVSFGYGEKPLIILPGLSDGLMTVSGKALMLANSYKRFFDKYTVYMFSRKNKLPKEYSIREMAEDQARAMQELGLQKASVLGVSQGGMVAQLLTAYFPELVEKLVIAVSAPRANEVVQGCVRNWISLAEQGDHKKLMIDTAEKSYSPEYLKKFRKIYPIIGTISKPSDYNRFLTNANAILSFDAVCDLSKITCPTLIIGGETDRIVGVEASYELRERITNSELFIYKGLGHAAYEEADDFNEQVFRFLEEE